jgi:hypothetical protein
MAPKRTRLSLSRTLAVGAGTLSIGFTSTAIAQRAETHPAPLRASPRTNSYSSQRPRHPRTRTPVASGRAGDAQATAPAPPKLTAAAPPKTHHAPARAQRTPARLQPRVAALVQSQIVAPAPTQTQVLAPTPQPQPSSSAVGNGLQPPAQPPTPALAAPTSVVSGGS